MLEREREIGTHQTTHNSGVIHAGIYYAPGSLKARLCVEGAAALYEYCAEHGIDAQRCGKLVVAVRAADLPRLDELERRARANGVPGLARLGADELQAVEPAARGLSALHSPNTGMVDFHAVAAAYAADLRGARRRDPPRRRRARAARARGPRRRRRSATARSSAPAVRSRAPARGRTGWRSPPGRGRRCGSCRSAAPTCASRPTAHTSSRGHIYPVPDPQLPFLGVHLSRTIAGEVLIGPTALLAPGHVDLRATLRWPGTWRVMRRWWRTGVHELAHAASRRLLVREASRFVPAIGTGDVRDGPAGVRAQAVGRDGSLVDDFLLARTGRAVHVLNAPSPAATASLAIAEMIASEVG